MAAARRDTRGIVDPAELLTRVHFRRPEPAPPLLPDTDPATVLDPPDERDRVAALDACLLALRPRPDPQAELATTLVDRIRTDRTIRRVTDFARAEGLSVRLLQRLFAVYVGVGPK